jgi:hypothetical protein
LPAVYAKNNNGPLQFSHPAITATGSILVFVDFKKVGKGKAKWAKTRTGRGTAILCPFGASCTGIFDCERLTAAYIWIIMSFL